MQLHQRSNHEEPYSHHLPPLPSRPGRHLMWHSDAEGTCVCHVRDGCCDGLNQLEQSMRSVNDKRAICRCLKAAPKSIRERASQLIDQISTACNVKFESTVSMNTNCNEIR
ncbi:non-specific lipid-transfer protein C, cotyledon-specific isoform-like [Punica granatum]|uniref:Non-specific lipid-transfer protein C, cotyledon-specific isoform-like n=1 Tax=Punica granatum TaxID=22663 RepID=A0A6P8ELS2_PUNGR|nr:non-specific lipid-transfer protein C, cotyledon-specific isoform-like [Punica granatum]